MNGYSEKVLRKWPVLIGVRELGHGGCERDAAKIAIGLDRSRFEPHVAVLTAGGDRTADVEAAGIPILDLQVRSFLNSTAIEGVRRMAKYVREHGIHLFHSYDVPMNFFGAPAARLAHIPAVITSQLSLRSLNSKNQRFFLRICDRLSDRVLVNSHAVGDSIVKAHGVPANKIRLCYNGVNVQQFRPGPRMDHPAINGASVVVGALCVMRPEKRIDWILRAFSEARKAHPGLRLLLVGSGSEVPHLMTLRDQLGLQEICHFEPGKADVVTWMQSMDIFINSSYSESFPNALLEAMACGCCVIGSAVGGIPELISDGVNGLLFDPNRLEELIRQLTLAATNTELRQRLRQQAVVTANQKFSMRVALECTQNLYEDLLAEKKLALSTLEMREEARPRVN